MYTTLFVYTIQLRNNEKEHQLYSVQLYIYMYTTSLQVVQVIYMIVHLHQKLYSAVHEEDSKSIFVFSVILLSIGACYWYILHTKMILKDY